MSSGAPRSQTLQRSLPVSQGGLPCLHQHSSSGHPAGSICTAPTPTRPPTSTGSSSAGPPNRPGPEFGGYFTFLKDGNHVAGCMHNDGQQGYPDAWTVYLTTDDTERTAAAASANGGQVHLAPMAVADNGMMAMVADPGQAAVGIWQPGTQKGFERTERDRHSRLVRAADAGLRRERRLLPRRVPVGCAQR